MSIKIENIKGNIKIVESHELPLSIVVSNIILPFALYGLAVPIELIVTIASIITFICMFGLVYSIHFLVNRELGSASYIVINGTTNSIEIYHRSRNYSGVPLPPLIKINRFDIFYKDVEGIKVEEDMDYEKWNPSPIFFPTLNLIPNAKIKKYEDYFDVSKIIEIPENEKAIKFLPTKNKSEAIHIVKTMADHMGVKGYDVSGEELPAS